MSHKIIYEAKSWSINTAPYSCPEENRKETKEHHDVSNKIE